MAADILIDSNVVLRHLLGDHREHSPAATQLLRQIERGALNGRLTSVAVAEVVWVLSGRLYGWPRAQVSEVLSSVVQMGNLAVPERRQLIDALEMFGRFDIDFIDAYQAAVARSLAGQVWSFDHDFDRIPGITRIEPPPAS